MIATYHQTFPNSIQTNYVTDGNLVDVASFPTAPNNILPSWYGLEEISVFKTQPTKVIVAFGDSITNGYQSTLNANKRYTDQLNDLATASNNTGTLLSVVNSGISGNRWIYDQLGPSGNSRFARDVLNVAGASGVILQLGLNDIFESPDFGQSESADQIIQAISDAAARANAIHLKVWIATITPAFASPQNGESKRQAVNAWIRRNTIAPIIDFAKVLGSPSDPERPNPSLYSPDFVHPNDAGYAAMAAAVDISALKQ